MTGVRRTGGTSGLRRRCLAQIKALGLPEPFNLTALRTQLERRRGRPIELVPVSTPPGALSGLWVAAGTADYVLYDSHTTPLHRDHIIAHELAHMVFGHQGGLSTRDLGLLLVPDANVDLIEHMLGRHDYASAEEEEAETLASMILQRLHFATTGGVSLQGKYATYPNAPLGPWRSRPERRVGRLYFANQVRGPVAAWRTYRRLQPLWSALRQAFPQIALNAAAAPWDIRMRLYRRVIEIRDGQNALIPFRDPKLADFFRYTASNCGLADQDLDASIEAAMLAAALRAKRSDRPPENGHSEGPSPTTLCADLGQETAWLERVASAFNRCLVQQQRILH